MPTGTIIYEVNLSVDQEIATEFASWLDEHIAAILKIDGFQAASWLELDNTDSTDNSRINWSVQYLLRDRAAFDNYITQHASSFRQDGINRFGDRFSATRRVLKVSKYFEI